METGSIWFRWTDPHQLLFRGIVPFLYDEGRRSLWVRKLRLWAAACCSRLSLFLSPWVVDEAQRQFLALADGRVTDDAFSVWRESFRERVLAQTGGEEHTPFEREVLSTLFAMLVSEPIEAAEMGTLGTSRVRALAFLGTLNEDADGVDEAIAGEDISLVALLREIAGNPFDPVPFDPSWRTLDALSIARQSYATGDFAALPVLADALQDAGCDSVELLAHLRDPHAMHVCGCWALDLVLAESE